MFLHSAGLSAVSALIVPIWNSAGGVLGWCSYARLRVGSDAGGAGGCIARRVLKCMVLVYALQLQPCHINMQSGLEKSTVTPNGQKTRVRTTLGKEGSRSKILPSIHPASPKL